MRTRFLYLPGTPFLQLCQIQRPFRLLSPIASQNNEPKHINSIDYFYDDRLSGDYFHSFLPLDYCFSISPVAT